MNKSNRNLILTMVALISFVSVIGLSLFNTQKEIDQSLASSAGLEEPEAIHIGLLQYTVHPSLDAISEGIVDTLAKNGYSDGLQMSWI